jgi:uncharacterized 2Fe-2S/4Fe-4S cluster protein (DUF4445 family)
MERTMDTRPEPPRTALVVFLPSGKRSRVPIGISVLEAARRSGEEIQAACGERQRCGKCRVRIHSGWCAAEATASASEHAGPWQAGEEPFISPAERDAGLRLACLAMVAGDLVVDVPETSRVATPRVSKALRPLPVELAPCVHAVLVQVPSATLEEPLADWERLAAALEHQHALGDLSIDLPALRALPSALAAGQGWVSASLWQQREIVRLQAGPHPRSLGLAIDIGTTTIALYLCDLRTAALLGSAGALNPQVRFGEDVLSRIAYHVNHRDGLAQMHASLLQGLERLMDDALHSANQALSSPLRREEIEDIVVCGNPTMQHLLLRADPEPLGRIPFSPVRRHSLDLKARDLGLGVNPGANLTVLPNPAGYIGGDTVAVILAEAPHHDDSLQLIIDIGTNGEIVLGNRQRLLATSCATGPALEGAGIRCGMRAAPGAIERVRIDRDAGSVDYKVVGRDAWRRDSPPGAMGVRGICGSGVLDLFAELYRSGVVAKSGAMRRDAFDGRLRQDARSGMWEFVLARAEETAIGQDVVLTQQDIRQVQLAKAALYTGCKLLLRRMNAGPPSRIKIAGAFGVHIDPLRAMMAGLFPDCPPEKIETIGNAAGDGCRLALLNRGLRAEADWIARRIDYLELTREPDFQQQFLAAIAIPHQADPFPHLEGHVPHEILHQRG